ncbi:MAG: methylated-DNA--[protein]-cysteine S-methyltransferase [Candidatus Baltobacteraceae bacterium]|jgi:methylated-DNA-[protein]-cysteine S-methyltransferase
MRCCDVEALWDDMRDCDEAQREGVLAHLRRCTTCQELYRAFEGVAYCLSCLPIVEPPAGLVPKILDHIRTVRGRPTDPDTLVRYDSPLGSLFVAFRPSGITYVAIDVGDPFEDVRQRIERRLRRPVRSAEVPDWVRAALGHYFQTWSTGAERIDITDLTEFEQAALHKAAQIPAGEVRSYSWIAREIGHPHAARAVGQVMARNPVALLLPCHRVVDASGALHQYGYGVEVKARILSMEGYRGRVPPARRTVQGGRAGAANASK